MTEIEKLILAVESKGLAAVNKDLATLDRAAGKGAVSINRTRIGMLSLSAAAGVAAVGIGLLFNKLVDSTKTYQQFDARLKIATGSVAKAAMATDALNDFAAKTPFSVAEATDAYIKLINLGLKPGEKALTSYGNTAATQGRQIGEFVQAVAAATTGEFDSLKSFGIKAKVEGDKITFIFRNQATQISNTATAIEDYMIAIGNTQFAGAMTEQMSGLGGAISNLGDAWDQLWITIAKQGPDSILVKGFRMAGDALAEFNTMLKSGELQAKVKAYGRLWLAAGEGIVDSFRTVGDFLSQGTRLWGLYAQSASNDFVEFFRFFPISAKAAFEAVFAYFDNLIDRLVLGFEYWVDSAKAQWERLVGYAEATGEAIYDFLFGSGNTTFTEDLDRVDRVVDAKLAGIEKTLAAQVAATDAEYEHIRMLIAQEHDQQITAVQEQWAEADRLRAEYDARVKTKQMETRDALEAAAPTQYISQQPASKEFQARVAFLEAGLEGENQVIEHSYEERKKLIMDSTATTLLEKRDLTLRLLNDALMSETESTKLAYQDRADFILASTETTETTKNALILKLTEEREKALASIEQKNMATRLSGAENFFNNMAQASKAFGEKGFKAMQAASIVAATIKMYESAVSAYASGVAAGGPYGIALGAVYAAGAIAAGAANIAAIKSQSYSGAYALGGMIPGGKFGLVGERGPEFVQGPAVVTSAASTAAAGKGTRNVRVTINNNGAPVEATSTLNGDELMITLQPLLNKAKAETKTELAAEVRKGGGQFSRAVEGTFGLSRAR